MKLAVQERLPDPKGGETTLGQLRSSQELHTPEDFAFGSQDVLEPRLSSAALARLGELSISTQEELLGYLETPHSETSELSCLVESTKGMKQFLREHANQEIVAGFDATNREEFAFGALIPEVSAPPPGSPPAAFETEGSQSAEGNYLIQGGCLPAIKDQGSRGTCVAFATCAVVEFAHCIHHGSALDLSEQFQFWHCKQNDQIPASNGTLPDVSFALLGQTGICDEAEWPYAPAPIPGNIPHDPPGPPTRIKPQPPNVLLAKFTTVASALRITPPTDLVKIQGYVSSGYAVAVAIPVFNSWHRNPYTRLTGNISMPLAGEHSTGGHAIVLIGWTRDSSFAGGGYFVVRNSWGTRWGSKCVFGAGNGTIPFDFIGRLNRFANTVRV